MKKVLLGMSVMLFLASCDVTIIEEPFDPRDQFTGRFEAEEYSRTLDAYAYFNINIIRDFDDYSNEVYIRNFYGAGIEVFAEVNGSKLTIPRQSVGLYIIEGFGSIEFDELIMTYTVEDTDPRSRLVDRCNTVSYRR